ncbi:error-prone DNA polymerase [Pseudocnuella soli]|uniref:error-prone DNA polymerase n=1 Tax=Pseudocnuella soli TaxID=2502779 RepID=UPI001053CEF5|nr:error-prone DNA polymerase [Pseudocnuella soli]
MQYAELQITSNFTFLRGASHPDELALQAASLGHTAFAITDRNTLAGVVRAHAAAKKAGIRLIPGCRLDLQDGPSLLAYPMHQQAYARLCTLLSTGNLRTEKGDCKLYKNDVYHYAAGMQLMVVPPEKLDEDFRFDSTFENALQEYKNAFGANLSLAAARRYNGDDSKQLYRLAQLSAQLDIPLAATNDVHYHIPERRQLQDVLTCIREGCTIYNAGYRLLPNAERYLKPAVEMERLFLHYPEAIEHSNAIAAACTFSLDELQYEYPEEITTEGRSPIAELSHLALQGAREIFGDPIPTKTANAIQYELHFIEQVNYAAYFLTVYDIVRFARSRGILCQGRGSAANSTICFCLGITSVNPEHFDLLFERFVSMARNEPPDIDVDFEHERREEVIQYIYKKYGRDRAAIVATVTQQHGKGAIRDVGKAMGLSLDVVGRLAGAIPHHYSNEGVDEGSIRELGLDPSDKHLRKVLQLTQQLIGFPRQLGQHTGGFVITNGKLTELCPVLNARMPGRTCIEWNKDDIDVLGFMKIDVLALGMLTCIRKAFDLTKQHYHEDHTLANIPQEDPAVYEMICRADTIGVFQIESRAQQTMLPRLKPKEFYDLVIEVAIVRPGPIQGNMVHPYLRRRNNEEAVTYPSKELEAILHRTLGVPLFQEQAMKIAIVAAGFSPAEADELRRSMATFKAQGVVSKFRDKLVAGMVKNGYAEDYAQQVFKQLEGFGSYGFPESHAASFALLVYVSSWLKCHYPDVFACALLNSMPMGFYQPAQIVQDARKHGVPILPIDINHSTWDNQLEPTVNETKFKTLRLGFRQVKGMRAEDIAVLLAGRTQLYTSINSLRDAGVSDAALERLADADAFRSIGLDRRQALWEVSTKDRPQALFAGQTPPDAIGEQTDLPTMQPSEHVVYDYATTSLSLKAHPVHFLRQQLSQLHVTPAADLAGLQNGQPVKVAGLVLVRQRPGTAKGIWFMTTEDETGFANLVIFPNVVEQYRKAILHARLIMVEGTLQVEGIVIHVLVQACYDMSALLRRLSPGTNQATSVQTLSRADEKSLLSDQQPKAVQQNLFGDARNFR